MGLRIWHQSFTVLEDLPAYVDALRERIDQVVRPGTEVVLHVAVFAVPAAMPIREFTVHWKHGGPGVVKGVATLAGDMQAALRAGLQAGSTPNHR